jgi:hypothetical protein
MLGQVTEQVEAVDFLPKFRDFWVQLCTRMQTFRDVFLYLERTQLKNRSFWQCAIEVLQAKLPEQVR